METKLVKHGREIYAIPKDSSLAEIRRAMVHFRLASAQFESIVARPDDSRRLVENYRTCTAPRSW